MNGSRTNVSDAIPNEEGTPSGQRVPSILFCSRCLNHEGGVANYANLILKHSDSNKYKLSHFEVGRPIGFSGHFLRKVHYTASTMLKLHRTLRTRKPDLVHLNPSLDFNSLLRDGCILIIAKLHHRPAMVFVHGWHQAVAKHFRFRWSVVRWLTRRFFNMADLILVLADDFKDELIRLGLDGEKVKRTTLMIDTHAIQAAEPSEIRDENLKAVIDDKESMKVLFMARFTVTKGVYALIESIPRIIEKAHVPLKFIFAGDGPEKTGMVKRVRELQVEKHVAFPGYVRGADKHNLLKHSDLFVLPSSHGEGFPNAILEAMGAGLPIVTTAVGGIKDVIEDGVHGFILEGPTGSAIVETLHEALGDPVRLQRIGERNRRLAREEYDAKVVIPRLEEHYDWVVSNASKQGQRLP